MCRSQLVAWDNQGVSNLPKKTTYLVPKGGRFYFRIRIPDDLRETFGKKEYSEPLGDLNKAQAEVRAAQLGAHWQARLLSERHRLGLAPYPPAPTPEKVRQSRVATLEEVQAVAALAAHDLLHISLDFKCFNILACAWDMSQFGGIANRQ